ncbi:MAG: DEAD/DEAH box helicase [Desulfocapsaceae bacterium]|nr:DEAD/DEAH box helicase [Desulfocapsaceae bacterium]
MGNTISSSGPEKALPDYIEALKKSPKFGPQVAFHRRFPAISAVLAAPEASVSEALRGCLSAAGIRSLYSHQQKALNAIARQRDIIVATPTASGKSLIYNLPVLQELLCNPEARALYLFPLKALAQDQLRTLREIAARLPAALRHPAIGAIYDGDTPATARRRIRDQPPPVLITNPDMLHLSLLPFHRSWGHFWAHLKFVIIDEVHTYRGVFGSHMAWVIRRLQRIAAEHGAYPIFVMASATIGNPGELGRTLLGREVEVVSETGAPRSGRDMLFLNPWDSAAYTACQLLEAALKRGLRTIVYTQSRKMTELITVWTRPRLGPLADALSSYRAGFLPEERREIERRLNSGELLGVISTSALELGIDIGDLDLCILVGYPGSIMAAWQRGGRVGRGGQESAIIMIAQEDALDQYFMRHPEDFFARDVESAALNPANPAIMEQHLHCAAAEIPLAADEPLLQQQQVRESVASLTARSVLLQSSGGEAWFATRKRPQRLVSLRGSGSQLTIINSQDGCILGEIDAARALKECHPGAVYLHQAQTWLVEKLDMLSREVVVTGMKGNYFTRAMSGKQTEIIEITQTKMIFGCRISTGRLRVTERVTGYQKRNNSTQKLVATLALDLPPQTFETEGLWLEIPDPVQQTMEADRLHFMGAIHALEHALISLFPLVVLCDRNDIGGISCPVHEQTGIATIFVYDGHPGGIGLASEAYLQFDQLLSRTAEAVRSCPCENGCPSCVHSPKCGSGNRPIDKLACIRLIDLIYQSKPSAGHAAGSPPQAGFKKIDLPDITARGEAIRGLDALPGHYGVFDLETMRSAEEVGGWQRADKMGISVAVVYDSQLEGYVTYLEHEIDHLVEHLMGLDLIVGFNNKRFDNQVLAGYSTARLDALPTIDLLEEVSNHLGYRLSLDKLAEHTLGVNKSADGLQALKWYKEGKIREIVSYCRQDVEMTRDLFLHGLEHGYFLFKNKAGSIVRLPLSLDRSILRALQRTRKG